jgi:glucan 1,3-beta-glucosidase
MLLVKILLFLGFSALLQAAPTPQASTAASSSGFWMANIQRQGTVAFGNSSSYQIFRNVKDFGAKGMVIQPEDFGTSTNDFHR